ncbi:glutathione peroxidase [Methylophaga nitratireducenticrescens]|uniref:Glutathione peroxidase n=2 Tax=Methylophaga nitratireducenticrescens TaxID=754476 RepID=I1XKL7_METNJ|nr:glutathione peroxidase [Methylophaga nitratireducenticrescens]AUZ84949.1 glutathione peroxidase [Methylophaga nitratireducenticrescens]
MRTLVLLLSSLMLSFSVQAAESCPEFLDYELPKLHSNETVNLCKVANDKPLLVVNTASHCGYTRQFEGLEALHQKYKESGLMVVGFASNDFNQEAKEEAEVERVCRENFGVTFTMIAPSFVTGQKANPVFQEINRQSEQPGWNFTKYLISKEGKVVATFPSKVQPSDKKLIDAIASLL